VILMTTEHSTEIRPFRLEIPDAEIADLHDRLSRTRWADDRRRYEELGGEALPDLSPLPAPPPIVTASPLDLEALLAQVDQITAELAT